MSKLAAKLDTSVVRLYFVGATLSPANEMRNAFKKSCFVQSSMAGAGDRIAAGLLPARESNCSPLAHRCAVPLKFDRVN